MNFYRDNKIYDFFDLSIILPFYKKFAEFEEVLPRNIKYFQRNGIELIIVLDTPEEENEVRSILHRYPFLNSKVIINREHHEWRNPAKALNVGIRFASNKYVLVASPETEFITDLIYQLRYMLQYNSHAYAIGQVAFMDLGSTIQDNIQPNELLPYGSIMVEKRFLLEINGYQEEFQSWGGDDDNLRARLDLFGLKKLFVSQAIGVHREFNSDGHRSRYKRNAAMPIEVFSTIYFPKEIKVNDVNWGRDFEEVAYSWKTRPGKEEQCKTYLDTFEEYWIKDPDIFQKEYKVVALIQVKNEIKHLPEVLLHLDGYCDGIILLDDGSTDGSYEEAVSEKLLIKVKKKAGELFDDLELRNITLRLAAFINIQWLYFMDADERFHEQYSDIYSIADKEGVDSVCFFVIHLWESESFYKINLPEREDGILPRFRMFRAEGPLQIIANRVLHFPATPFAKRRLDASIVIKHLGNIDAVTRKMKYERYTAQDKEGLTQGYTYDYLIEEHSSLKSVDSLRLNL